MSYQRQTRIVRIEIDLPMEFPKEWDDEQINFHLNESSWCFSNIIEALEEYDEEHGCICSICNGKVYELSKGNGAADGKRIPETWNTRSDE